MGKKVSRRQEKEARCQDGRNIPSGMTVAQEQRYLRGVFAEELRGDYRSGSFQREFVNVWSILGSNNPDFWSDEAYTPDGVPDGDVFDPYYEEFQEPMCNLRGHRIY